jgi:two-component system cell cycle sensor histidine kinase/response regulator CckA
LSKGKKSVARPTSDSRAADPVAGLAGSIAHDFSNLLMIIRNAASFLKEGTSAQESQEYISQILHATDRATRLTQQLQAIGRSQLLQPDIVRPAEVIRGIGGMLRELVPEDVDFRVAIRAPDAAVRFDATQLPIVAMNLVSFAADRIERRGRIVLSVREDSLDKKRAAKLGIAPGACVVIVVARSGPALAAPEDEAFRPRLAGKSLPRGTDLRLASVFGVVAQSGGAVDLTNELGTGTAFSVYLPVVEEPVSAQTRRRGLRVSKEVTGNEMVLVVEDDPNLRAMVRESLEFYGYTALEAADGDEALRQAALFNAMPDLLLTDLVMPNVTGRELIEALSIEGRLPKVLMMSGYTDDDVLRRASPTQSYPFIKKPFTHEELAAKVREVLDTA